MNRFIDWKLRIKNPTFWLSIGIAFFTPILAYAGISAPDITSWSSLAALISDAFANPFVLLLVVSSVYNAIIDPTTPGVKDYQKKSLTQIIPQSTGQTSEENTEQSRAENGEELND